MEACELGTSLTEEEVHALPDGTPIIVLWSGGNGPHKYYLVNEDDCIYADTRYYPSDRYYNPLSFIGQERYHTRVWINNGSV